MGPLNKFSRKFPIIFVLLSIALPLVLIKYVYSAVTFSVLGDWAESVARIILIAICFVWVLLFVGPSAFASTAKSFAYGMKKSIYFLIVMFLFAVVAFIGLLSSGTGISNNIFILALQALIIYFTVGFMEETCMRICVLGGLLSKMGNSKKGIVWAIIISSLIFGFIHNFWAIMNGKVTDSVAVLEVVVKTLESGVAGLLFATIYIRTQNIWSAIIVHMIGDFFPAYVQTLSTSSSSSSDPSNQTAILGQLILLVLYIPVLIMCIKELKKQSVPCMGPLYEDFTPIVPLDSYQDTKNRKDNLSSYDKNDSDQIDDISKSEAKHLKN